MSRARLIKDSIMPRRFAAGPVAKTILAMVVTTPLIWSAGFASGAEAHSEMAGLLFREAFDDAGLLERGWYDGQRFTISREGSFAGGCLVFHWKADTSIPDSSSGLRRLFEPTDEIYVRFQIKLAKDWGW